MDTLNDLFADILFDAGIKSLILAGSIWLCLKVTSRVSAARRHLAGAAGMFALILLPAFSLIAPKWEHTAPWTLPSAWTASDNNAAPKQITMAAPVSESVASNAAAKASTPAPGAVVAPVVADESTGTIQVDRRTWVLGLGDGVPHPALGGRLVSSAHLDRPSERKTGGRNSRTVRGVSPATEIAASGRLDRF